MTAPIDDHHPRIWVSGNRTFVESKKYPDGLVLLDAELQLDATYIHEDAAYVSEREHYAITLKLHSPEGARLSLLVPNAAFNSAQELSKYFHGILRPAAQGDNSHLQGIVLHMIRTYYDNSKLRFHSRVLYKSGAYHFPKFTVRRDAIEFHCDGEIPDDLKREFPLVEGFDARSVQRQTLAALLREHWAPLLKMHVPALVSGVIGIAVGHALRPLFAEKLPRGFRVPSLNVRGPLSTGKSTTVGRLLSIFGMSSVEKWRPRNWSAGAILERMEQMNFHPLVIDGFDREAGWTPHRIARLQSLVTRHIEGGFIIVGEEPLEMRNDEKVLARIIPISTDDCSRKKRLPSWCETSRADLSSLCPYFFQFILQQDARKLFQIYVNLEDEMAGRLGDDFDRFGHPIAQNIACAWVGCRVFDMFTRSFEETVPSIEEICNPVEALIEQYSDLKARIHLQNRRLTDAIASPIVAQNKLLTMIQRFGSILSFRNSIINDLIKRREFLFSEDETKNELRINHRVLAEVFARYTSARDKRNPERIGSSRLMASFALETGQSWIKARSQVFRYKRKSVRCDVFDLSALRRLDAWPARSVLREIRGRLSR